jgi:hypothetical protein
VWSIIFHVAKIDVACDCSEDDDEPSKYGCKEEGTKNNADECRYIYGALNWASATRGTTTVLVILLAVVAAPIFYMIFYGVIIGIRKMAAAPGSDNNDSTSLRERQDTIDHVEANGCGSLCRYEMKCSRLPPTDENWVENFKSSSFKGVSDSVFLYMRLFWFLFILAILIASLIEFYLSLEFYLIFVTHWTLLFELIYLFCALVSTYKAQKLINLSTVPIPSSSGEEGL